MFLLTPTNVRMREYDNGNEGCPCVRTSVRGHSPPFGDPTSSCIIIVRVGSTLISALDECGCKAGMASWSHVHVILVVVQDPPPHPSSGPPTLMAHDSTT